MATSAPGATTHKSFMQFLYDQRAGSFYIFECIVIV